MDREKLEKAKEEYIKKFGQYWTTIFDVSDAFNVGADWLMQQPLSERLTDEEKEKIIFAYKASVKLINGTKVANPNMAEVFKGQQQLLISIFGAGLFNDK